MRGDLHGLRGLPGCTAVDKFGLVEALMVSAGAFLVLAPPFYGGLDSGFGEPLAVPYRHVLRQPVRMMNEVAVPL